MKRTFMLAILLATFIAADAQKIDAGSQHSINLCANGMVGAWGVNTSGNLGNGTTNSSSLPVQTINLWDVRSLAAGYHHTLALRNDSTVWAWGDNSSGKCGVGNQVPVYSPVKINSLSGIIAVAAGEGQSLALKSDGTVLAWGLNSSGELGTGSSNNYDTLPTPVVGLTNVIAISAGATHCLALKADGTVWAWGNNYYSQLGDGGSTNMNTPVQAIGLANSIAIAAGFRTTYAVKNDGTVWSLGHNYYGQLGSGTVTTYEPAPVMVAGLSGVSAVDAGTYHTVALKTDGTVYTWGWNAYGQLGDGSTVDHPSATLVPGMTGITSIAAGSSHSLAMRSNDTVWTWGSNMNGQLGDGTTTDRINPTMVNGITCVPVGITQTISSNEISVSVSPNPFTSSTTFTVANHSAANLHLALIDVLGKEVSTKHSNSTNSLTIQRDDLPSGLYFYKLYSGAELLQAGKLIAE